MRKVIFLLSVLLGGSIGLSSCKKCYTCSREIITTVNGAETKTMEEEEVCGTKIDMEAYGSVGYECAKK